MRFKQIIFCLLFLNFSSMHVVANDVYQFSEEDQRALFKEVTEELRCVVCQNQNLADSNADIANDMKAEVYEMVKSGQDKDQIVGFFTDRYGEFVRYKPAFNMTTAAAWLSPFILLFIVLGVVFSKLRSAPTPSKELSSEDAAKAEALLNKAKE